MLVMRGLGHLIPSRLLEPKVSGMPLIDNSLLLAAAKIATAEGVGCMALFGGCLLQYRIQSAYHLLRSISPIQFSTFSNNKCTPSFGRLTLPQYHIKINVDLLTLLQFINTK